MSPKVTGQHLLETRTKVLNAAEALFAKKGYYDTSMDEIAEGSGLSKGAIYGHFKSKEELFIALQDLKSGDQLSGLLARFSPDDSARTKLEKAGDLMFDYLVGSSRNDCRVGLEFEVAAPRMKSLQQRRDARFGTVVDFTREIIEEGIRKGEFKQDIDPQATALFLASLADGLSLEWATTSLDFDWGSLKANMKKVLFEGLLAEPKAHH